MSCLDPTPCHLKDRKITFFNVIQQRKIAAVFERPIKYSPIKFKNINAI